MFERLGRRIGARKEAEIVPPWWWGLSYYDLAEDLLRATKGGIEMSTEEQTRPFFTELHKQQEDAVSAINKLERIADAVFGPEPPSLEEEKHLTGGERRRRPHVHTRFPRIVTTLRAAFPRLSATASRWVCRSRWKSSIRRVAESVRPT